MNRSVYYIYSDSGGRDLTYLSLEEVKREIFWTAPMFITERLTKKWEKLDSGELTYHLEEWTDDGPSWDNDREEWTGCERLKISIQVLSR